MVGLQYGLSEASERSTARYPAHYLSDHGIYGECHMRLDKFVLTSPQCVNSKQDEFVRFCRLNIVHECEEAKSWLVRQSDGASDYWHQRLQYDDQRADDLKEAAVLLHRLRKLEARQPYWIRQAFAAALVKQAPKGVGFNATLSDANHPDGGEHVAITIRERELLEPQILAQAALNHTDDILASAADGLMRFS